MNDSNVGSGHQDTLRAAAERLLKSGTAPSTRFGALGVDALEVLHRLAHGTDNADDSLKLLHELRTYQVELDLQYEQLLENEREMTQELARYQQLYQAAPAGYLVVELDGLVVEANYAAAELFAMPLGALQGSVLQDYLSAWSRPALVEMQRKLVAGDLTASCIIIVGEDKGSPRRLRVNARIAPGGDTILMMMCECVEASPPI